MRAWHQCKALAFESLSSVHICSGRRDLENCPSDSGRKHFGLNEIHSSLTTPNNTAVFPFAFKISSEKYLSSSFSWSECPRKQSLCHIARCLDIILIQENDLLCSHQMTGFWRTDVVSCSLSIFHLLTQSACSVVHT